RSAAQRFSHLMHSCLHASSASPCDVAQTVPVGVDGGPSALVYIVSTTKSVRRSEVSTLFGRMAFSIAASVRRLARNRRPAGGFCNAIDPRRRSRSRPKRHLCCQARDFLRWISGREPLRDDELPRLASQRREA